MQRAEAEGVSLLVFPELSPHGLHLRRPVSARRLAAAAPSTPWSELTQASGTFIAASPSWACRWRWTIRSSTAPPSCIAAKLLGLVPKSFIPNYKEFYEGRWFAAAATAAAAKSSLHGTDRPVRHRPPLRRARHRGLDRSASKSAKTCGYRCRPVRTRRWPGRRCWSTCRRATRSSARPTIAGSSSSTSRAAAWPPTSTPRAASGESTTDVVFGGHCLIAENGALLAESTPLPARGRPCSSPTSISTACAPTACAPTASATPSSTCGQKRAFEHRLVRARTDRSRPQP